MNRTAIIGRVRSLTRDLSNSIYREVDIVDFINEGVDRFKQVIPELRSMEHLINQTDEPRLLPDAYHALLATYASSRCFFQDEQHYQASTLMNEFEVKLGELKIGIENGDVVITQPDGSPIEDVYREDFVEDVYFNKGVK